MQATVWEKANKTLLATAVHTGMNRLNGEHYIQLTDGIETFVIHGDDLKESAQEITDSLKPHEFTHSLCMQTHGGGEEQTMQMLDMMMQQCSFLTANGAVPFSLITEDQINTVREKNEDLTEAVGYWNRAVAFLDQEPSEETGEMSLVIRLVLHGVIFAARIQKDNGQPLQEFELSEHYQVRPRFSKDAIEALGGALTVGFDLVDMTPSEFEEVPEDEAAELNLKH